MATENKERRGMAQLSADEPAHRPGRRRQAVPVGLERVLYVAAEDPAFREALGRDPVAAVAARGLSLRPSERAMLEAVPLSRLMATVEGLDTSPATVERRGFLRAVAAGAAAAAVVNCGDDVATPDQGPPGFDATGIRPDTSVDTGPPMAGVRPTVDIGPTADAGVRDYQPPTDTVEVPDMPAATGIRPDGAPDGS